MTSFFKYVSNKNAREGKHGFLLFSQKQFQQFAVLILEGDPASRDSHEHSKGGTAFLFAMNKLPDLSNIREFNELQRQGIKNFIGSICPNRWNVFTDFKDYKPNRGILNIHLEILNYEDERDHECWGMVHAGIGYGNGIGDAHLILQPSYLSKRRLTSIIIHELAHLGTQRWVSFRRKCHLKKFGSTLYFPEDLLEHDRHKSTKFRQMQQIFRNRIKMR